MTKFEKVKKALEEKTRNTGNWITLTTELDARHKGCKYTTVNVITRGKDWQGYKTLDEVIKQFELEIQEENYEYDILEWQIN